MSRPLARVSLLLTVVLAVIVVDMAPPSASADSTMRLSAARSVSPSSAPRATGKDPFYRYTGAVPLARIAPGTIVKKRSTDLAIGTTSTPVSVEQLLYRTTGEVAPHRDRHHRDRPPRHVLAGAGCGLPELLRRTGSPVRSQLHAAGWRSRLGESAADRRGGADHRLLCGRRLRPHDHPDFEGEHLEWTAGQESGYGSLDALRATEHYLGMASDSPVGLTGYSGGSIAADWASELAPSYAPSWTWWEWPRAGFPSTRPQPHLHQRQPRLVGDHPGPLVALSRAFNSTSAYLSPYGKKLTAQVQTACIGSFYGAYPGLTVQQIQAQVQRPPAGPGPRAHHQPAHHGEHDGRPGLVHCSWPSETPTGPATGSWSVRTSKRSPTNTAPRAYAAAAVRLPRREPRRGGRDLRTRGGRVYSRRVLRDCRSFRVVVRCRPAIRSPPCQRLDRGYGPTKCPPTCPPAAVRRAR